MLIIRSRMMRHSPAHSDCVETWEGWLRSLAVCGRILTWIRLGGDSRVSCLVVRNCRTALIDVERTCLFPRRLPSLNRAPYLSPALIQNLASLTEKTPRGGNSWWSIKQSRLIVYSLSYSESFDMSMWCGVSLAYLLTLEVTLWSMIQLQVKLASTRPRLRWGKKVCSVVGAVVHCGSRCTSFDWLSLFNSWSA